jgi:hypothetical protein
VVDRTRDFTGLKVVFVDWTNVYAGYGLKPRAWADPRNPRELVPKGINLVAFPGRVDPEPCFAAETEPESFYISAYSTVLVEGNKLRLYYERYLADDRFPDSPRYSTRT